MFNTITEVKEANKDNGYYFFNPDTMRFFDSKIESELYDNQCFITSEKKCFNDYTRVYSVRKVKKGASIKTLYSQIENYQEAKRLCKEVK